MNEQAAIRWGVLGTGRMAATMAAEIGALAGDGLSITAVASRTIGAAGKFADRFNIPRAYGSEADLARDPSVDAIYIATPPSEHARQMRLCLKEDKAVLCEKPFTSSFEEAREVVQLARTRRLFLMEAMWTRFLPAVSALRGLLAEGLIGAPQLLIAGGAFIPAVAPEYYLYSRALGGGVMNDAGVYLISMSAMLLGPALTACVSGDLGPTGVDEQAAMILEHAGSARALLYVSLRTRRAPDLELLGTEGRIHVAAPVFRPECLTLTDRRGISSTREYPIAGTGYSYQLREVAQAMRAGECEVKAMSWAESLSVMETLDRIRRDLGCAQPGTGAA